MYPARTWIFAALAVLVLLPETAWSVEFRLDGYDRIRAQFYDSLSLTRDGESPLPERTRGMITHRLRLEPHLRINPYLDVFGQLDLLDGQVFGSNAQATTVPGLRTTAGTDWLGPPSLSGTVMPGTGTAEGFIKRVWMEIRAGELPLRFRLGRMPNHWGAGLVYNDGSGWDADYGDSVDRIEAAFDWRNFLVRAAFDTWAEDLVNVNDDVFGVTISAGYMGEIQAAGLLFEHRWGGPEQTRFNASLLDLWGRTKLGPVKLEIEAALQWGGGSGADFGGGEVGAAEEVRFLSGGGVLRGELDITPIRAGFETMLASGDKDLTDEVGHTFVVDRDRDVGFLMFEQAMPVFQVDPDLLEDDPDNIDDSRTVMNEGVRNAFVVSPFVHYKPYEQLDISLQVNFGWRLNRTSDLDDTTFLGTEGRYLGTEAELGGTWRLWESFTFGGRFSLLLPGPHFNEAYRRPVVGGELRAIIDFD